MLHNSIYHEHASVNVTDMSIVYCPLYTVHYWLHAVVCLITYYLPISLYKYVLIWVNVCAAAFTLHSSLA